MAEIHSNKVKEWELDTVMGEDITFKGSLKFSDPLMIKGKLSGDINSEGLLYIEENAVVEANIKGIKVEVRGEVIGNILASDSVLLFSTAKVTGDIIAPKVKMENGCYFSGQCKMGN